MREVTKKQYGINFWVVAAMGVFYGGFILNDYEFMLRAYLVTSEEGKGVAKLIIFILHVVATGLWEVKSWGVPKAEYFRNLLMRYLGIGACQWMASQILTDFYDENHTSVGISFFVSMVAYRIYSERQQKKQTPPEDLPKD